MKFIVKNSNKVDLHIHTNISDGNEEVWDIVERAKELGLEVISITDHNCDDARFFVNKKENIKIIPGCEISVQLNGKSIHLLAYNYNYLFSKLVLPRIMDEIYYKGRMDIKKVCKLIHLCGGKAVLAHPFKYKYDGKEIVKEALKEGCIDGIECIHPYHTQEEIDYLLDICEKNDLYVSGGSDFHKYNRNIRNGVVQRDLNELPIINSTIEKQLIRAKEKYNIKKR